MTEPKPSIRIDSESDEYEVTTVEPIPPRKRDWWAVLRGRYTPKVKKVKRLTVKGMNRALKQTWTAEKMGLNNTTPFLENLRSGEQATVPIQKRKARRS